MKKTKELSLNTKRKNTSKTTRSSGLKLKPRLVMSALAHNTWLRHAPKFKTGAETKTESTNSLISTRGKKSKQTTSTPSRRKSPTSTREKYMEKVSRYIDNDPQTQTQSLTKPEQTQTMTII